MEDDFDITDDDVVVVKDNNDSANFYIHGFSNLVSRSLFALQNGYSPDEIVVVDEGRELSFETLCVGAGLITKDNLQKFLLNQMDDESEFNPNAEFHYNGNMIIRGKTPYLTIIHTDEAHTGLYSKNKTAPIIGMARPSITINDKGEVVGFQWHINHSQDIDQSNKGVELFNIMKEAQKKSIVSMPNPTRTTTFRL